MITNPTQHEMYTAAMDDALFGAIRLEVSQLYGGTVNIAQVLEFREKLQELDFLAGHHAECAGELMRVYKIPEAYSILRVNQLQANPLVKFLESPEPGLVRCVLE